MRSAVILASIVFWLSVFNAVIALFIGGIDTAIIWLTISLFWLRFETLYATRGCQSQQSGASQ